MLLLLKCLTLLALGALLILWLSPMFRYPMTAADLLVGLPTLIWLGLPLILPLLVASLLNRPSFTPFMVAGFVMSAGVAAWFIGATLSDGNSTAAIALLFLPILQVVCIAAAGTAGELFEQRKIGQSHR